MRMRLQASLFGAVLLLMTPAIGAIAVPVGKDPLVIAHRGYPCLYPEETMAGYRAALNIGADFIEMDVVSTKDGVLLTAHDIILDKATNILDVVKEHPDRFAAGMSTPSNFNPYPDPHYFLKDFTYDEVKELKVKQRDEFRDQSRNNMYTMTRFDELLTSIKKEYIDRGAQVGLYVELKDPKYHESYGLALQEPIRKAFAEAGYTGRILEKHIIMQSFNKKVLRDMYDLFVAHEEPVPAMVWLLDCNLVKPNYEEMVEFAEWGYGIGPRKTQLSNVNWRDEDCWLESTPSEERTCDRKGDLCAGRIPDWVPLDKGQQAEPSDLLRDARKAGLKVHAWTFRNENEDMCINFGADAQLELDYYAGDGGLNLDGMFVDCPPTAISWRESHDAEEQLVIRRKSSTTAVVLLSLALAAALAALAYMYFKRASKNARSPRKRERGIALSTRNGLYQSTASDEHEQLTSIEIGDEDRNAGGNAIDRLLGRHGVP